MNKLTWGIAAATASTLAIVAAIAIPWPRGSASGDEARTTPSRAGTTGGLGLAIELVDADGVPVPGARVLCAPAGAGTDGWSIARAGQSNPGGMALLAPLSSGWSNIAVMAPGRLARIDALDAGSGEGRLVLEPGSDLVVKLTGHGSVGTGAWMVAARPLDADGECASRFAAALDAFDAFEAAAGRGGSLRTDDGASLRRANDQGEVAWSGLPRCSVLVEAWPSAGGDSFLPAQGAQVHRRVVDLADASHAIQLMVAPRGEFVVEVLDGGRTAAQGATVLVASWNEHDGARGLLAGRVDATGTVVFRSDLPVNGSKLVAYANLGARWAVTNALRIEELDRLRLELPPAEAKPLSIRCVDADGNVLQPTHLEVLDAGPLAAHGLPHARLWMSAGESTTCPVVHPHGSMRVAATIDSARHAGLRAHAIVDVQPGAESIDVVFPPASSAPTRGSVEFTFEGLGEDVGLALTCHGAMQRDWRGTTTNGKTTLPGFAPGASSFVVRTGDGRVARGVVDARAGETTRVACRLEPEASLVCELSDSSTRTRWTLLGCDASGVPTVVLAEGQAEAGESTIRVDGLPAGAAQLVCTRGGPGCEPGERRTLTSIVLESGSKRDARESDGAEGTRLQLDWPADMEVRLVTFELQPEGASKSHAPLAFWSRRVPSDAKDLVLDGLPRGRWIVTAWPRAGAETHSGRASFVAQDETLAVRLVP